MNYKKMVKEDPLTLTILPTHKCTASCKNCCFGCNPKVSHIMPYEEMVYHIDEAVKHFSTLSVLVISGGECFLLGEDLDRIIHYATKKGLSTRVVTNGYWAISYESAFERIHSLVSNGLKEFNLSTGDDHQKYIKLENIINATKAAIDAGLPTVYIAVESHVHADFTADTLKSNPQISEYIETGYVSILPGSWIKFKNHTDDSNLSECNCRYTSDQAEDGCNSLFKNIAINPYSELLACCGLTVEYNEFLKLGNLRRYIMQDLYNAQFEDAYKLWLYVLGPKHIYDSVMKFRKLKPQEFVHTCAYCIEAIKDSDNIDAIKKILPSELPNILYQLETQNLIK